jgi:hypothetical protein
MPINMCVKNGVSMGLASEVEPREIAPRQVLPEATRQALPGKGDLAQT